MSFNYLCANMIQRLSYTFILLLLACTFLSAQVKPQFSKESGSRSVPSQKIMNQEGEEVANVPPEKSIPSVIKNWQLTDYGAVFEKSKLDTTLNFFHDYQPYNKISFSNTFTGTLGGAYLANDFFKRTYNSDFYFYHSFDVYSLFPNQIQYFNTTTPYSLLDYSQSENKSIQTETRFNVFHSQNVNEKLNLAFFYNQARSKGYYDDDEDDSKYHNVGLFGSYQSDKVVVHGNVIFNRVRTEEDGGVEAGQDLNADELNLNLSDARAEITNNTVHFANEYRIGKYIEEKDTTDEEYVIEKFIPRTGFIYDVEISGNKRGFFKDDVTDGFFENTYLNEKETADETQYTRLTNVFQIKFYEAPDRKYTFGKRIYIGNDQLWYRFPEMDNSSTEYVFNLPQYFAMETGKYIFQGYKWNIAPSTQYSFKRRQNNSFLGGAIYRAEGKFWQWNASGKMYFGGYRSGQTELEGYINKPLIIGADTTSLRVEGSLKTLVPDYFEQNYFSNHFRWRNHFNNINEMIIRGKINSQKYKASVGVNYALIGNFIYNDEDALPTQAKRELLILSAWLDKDFESTHWLIRSRILWQSASETDYIHLPDFAAYLSLNYRTLISKVMYAQFGFDARYTTKFYADAYEPATARFYLQNEQQIGNYPFVDFHVDLKLKRTRVFFNLMNVTSGLLDGNFWAAPSYPLYKRTYRIGVAWSFYN